MSLTGEEEDSKEIFKELQRFIPSIEDITSDPQALILGVHRKWKEEGGLLSGKPRHSDRFLDDQLKLKNKPVRSLTPKLVGKTRLRAEDAEKLLGYFLTNWPRAVEGEASESKKIKYAPLLTSDEIDEITGYVVGQIESIGELGSPDGAESPVSQHEEHRPPPGRDLGELIPKLFEESAALITVATERSTVAQSPKTVLIGFRDLMNDLHTVEQQDEKQRPLIWILDLGRKTFRDLEARLRYVGFINLQMRFKALTEFEDRGREERWKWLLSRAVFVIQDTSFDEPFDMKGVKRPAFLAHHVSLTALAPAWASSPNFRTLYGRELEDIDQRSFSVFFNAKGWPYDNEEDDDEPRHCRYFGYASFARDISGTGDKVPRGLELPYPGFNYEDAYKTVYAASTELLGLKTELVDLPKNSGKHAIAQLRYLGFRLVGLEDFMKL